MRLPRRASARAFDNMSDQAPPTASTPSLLIRVVFGISTIPMVVGLVAVFHAERTGVSLNERLSGMSFFFADAIPASFVLGLLSAAITWRRWHRLGRTDRVLGLLPLALPIIGVALVGAVATEARGLR
jgi:hypothetical protein